ncbi:MAG TPA: chloride channel protein [Roseiarcus sp.]|nr:chloride channel protein [Roseiarcus sp.]
MTSSEDRLQAGPEGAAAPARSAYRLDRALPTWMRAFVRTRESGLLFAAAIIGLASGLLDSALNEAAQKMHEILFAIPRGALLSVTRSPDPWRTVAMPALGGLVLALIVWWAKDRFRGRLADAIEANALRGGRLSPGGSLYIVAQTFFSNGFGASVGLEAAYTQLCSAFGSLFGRALGARRSDMRLLVGCGAAGAIAGAFDAPIAGAFYAFEAILGAYTLTSLAPVATSAILASLVTRKLLGRHEPIISAPLPSSFALIGVHIVAVALFAAAASVALMAGVAALERLWSDLKLAPALRLALGGLAVGALGLIVPEALGAGHGALILSIAAKPAVSVVALVLAIKGLSSAISLSSGFRGGLFFCSLLIGALVGRLYGAGLDTLLPGVGIDPAAASILGMAAVGTGVIGAPVAMTFFALETTSDLRAMVAVLFTSALAGLIVRETFGYSFATWRFHLRGEAIRGPQDVGWMRDLKAARLMRKDFRAVAADRTIAAARVLFPVGTTRELLLTDVDGGYAGLVLVNDLHAAARDDAEPIIKLAQWRDDFLLAQTTIRGAIDAFDKAEADVLAVLADAGSRRIVGILSEAHALRVYGQELEKQNRAFLGR